MMKYTTEYSSRFRILKGGKISLVVSALIAGSTMSFAAPVGGSVTTGNATINQSGLVTTINQSSNKASINWQNFSITPSETVNFIQPSSSAITLNRVIGTTPSLIQGAINANGQVFLINPNGVLFANGSQVNVGGLVASTLNITDANFQAGNYLFEGNSQNSIINMGTINTSNGGYVAMMGKTVQNEGTIAATMGSVQLASGEKISLNLNGNSLVKLTIDQGAINALVENKGLIQADGGEVYLTTQALNTILDGVVNNTGIIEAQSLNNVDGKIILFAHGGTANIGGTIDASAPDSGDGGFIETSGQNITISDTFKVSTKSNSGNSGQWLIDPVDITIAASGGSVTGATIATALASTDVTLDTSGSGSCTNVSCGPLSGTAGKITINDDITVTNSSGSNTTLTLNATGAIDWRGGAVFDATSGSNGVNVVLNSNAETVSNDGVGEILLGQTGGSLGNKAVIKTNGGNFSATADSVTNPVNAALTVSFVDIDTGVGSLVLTGKHTNPGTGTYDSRHGLSFDGTTTDSFVLKSGGGMILTGTNKNPNASYFGLNMLGGTFIATGNSNITFNADNSTPTGYAMAMRSYTNGLTGNVLAENGDIYFNASNVSLNYDNAPSNWIYGYQFGAKAATAVTSSSADIFLNIDNIGALGRMTINTSGALAIQSKTTNSWSSDQVINLETLNIEQIGGIKLGNTGNTSNLAVTLPVISGGIEINGGITTLNSDVLSSNGNITLNTNLSRSGAILVEANSGNIYLNGNVTTSDTSGNAIVLNAGKNTAAGTATGGNIVVSGAPTITTGSGGTAKLYSGSVSGSTGLTSLVGSGTGRFRYNSDETTDFSAGSWTNLSTGLNAIYREAFTVSGTISSETITYGDTNPNFTLSGGSLQNGDSPVFSITNPVYSSANKLNAGSYGVTASGLAGLGYTIGSINNGSLGVTPKAISISGLTANDKVFDGTTTATVNTSTAQYGGLITGDDLSVLATGAFADSAVGNNKIVTLTSSYQGLDIGNYTITDQTSTTASITPVSVPSQITNNTTTIVNQSATTPILNPATSAMMTPLNSTEPTNREAIKLVMPGSSYDLVGSPSGQQPIKSIELNELKVLASANGISEIRVPLGNNSIIELINGGLNLPNGISQEFYVVDGKSNNSDLTHKSQQDNQEFKK